VNLSEFILAAVLPFAALCIQLRKILREWFMTTVLTQPSGVAKGGLGAPCGGTFLLKTSF